MRGIVLPQRARVRAGRLSGGCTYDTLCFLVLLFFVMPPFRPLPPTEVLHGARMRRSEGPHKLLGRSVGAFF